jgi:acyl-homoserine lactone acylase PvdQ
MLPRLLDILDLAATGQGSDAALAWQLDASRLSEAHDRLLEWEAGGYHAASGVETFYHSVQDGELDDAVGAMIYYAWQAAFVARVFDDEALEPGIWRPYAESGVIRSLVRMLDGRGPDNPMDLASWVEQTQESVFFDDGRTQAIERSGTLAVEALSEALDALTATSSKPGEGGFGTDDMDAWLWGMRHMVRFESILATALGDDPLLRSLTRDFAINTGVLPLADDLALGDPRRDLEHFPRAGGPGSVDQAGHGFGLEDYSYGNGPAFRMVFSLGPDGVQGYNILPGGQSALVDSPHFADQAARWLGNQAVQIRYTLDEVLSGASARDRFEP